MSVEQQGKSRAPESGPAFDVPIFILDLIESFIKANASVLAVTVEDDRPNGVLKILTEDKSPRLHTISDTSRSGSPRSVGDPAGPASPRSVVSREADGGGVSGEA